MNNQKSNTSRAGFQFALLSALAVLSVAAIRLQAADTDSDHTKAAGDCAMLSVTTSAASCHGSKTMSKDNATATESAASCHADTSAAAMLMKSCAMMMNNGAKSAAAWPVPAPHKH